MNLICLIVTAFQKEFVIYKKFRIVRPLRDNFCLPVPETLS